MKDTQPVQELQEKSKDKNKDFYKDLLFRLAKIIRNKTGNEPSRVGHDLGIVLCEVRQADGRRYDREVLLMKE